MNVVKCTIDNLGDLRALLVDALASFDGPVWFVDELVHFDCDEEAFYHKFLASDADLLGTFVRDKDADQTWDGWDSFSVPEVSHDLAGQSEVAARLILCRLSRAGMRYVVEAIDAGVTGHVEVVVPTLILHHGLKIEDIGGRGAFTPLSRRGKYYRPETWKWGDTPSYFPGHLHYPVPYASHPLATSRFGHSAMEHITPKLLFVSPIGKTAKELLPNTLKAFQKAGASFRFVNYDESFRDGIPGAEVIHDRGGKWELAMRHLTPETVSDFDYLFFWDDDLLVDDFDPLRFVGIMRANRLSVAQPGIHSSYPLSHEITKAKSTPAVRRCGNTGHTQRIVGRLTNFVEIMAPVYTRNAWRELWPYLAPGNKSGWGYDYIPLGQKGVIDVMSVIHTRPVQSLSKEALAEQAAFLRNQGFFRYTPQDLGWLFETCEQAGNAPVNEIPKALSSP